jgi:cytochrome c biogenesis factor
VRSVVLDAQRVGEGGPVVPFAAGAGPGRRQYAGFLIHLGFFFSGFGRDGFLAGKTSSGVRFARGADGPMGGTAGAAGAAGQRELPDKLIAEAELEVVPGGRSVTLIPARHYHRLHRSWTTKVAIDSSWRSDFYVVLQGGDSEGVVHFSFVESPMMRWMWLSGWIAAAGTLLRLWPARRRRVAVAASNRRRDKHRHPRSGRRSSLRDEVGRVQISKLAGESTSGRTTRNHRRAADRHPRPRAVEGL